MYDRLNRVDLIKFFKFRKDSLESFLMLGNLFVKISLTVLYS